MDEMILLTLTLFLLDPLRSRTDEYNLLLAVREQTGSTAAGKQLKCGADLRPTAGPEPVGQIRP